MKVVIIGSGNVATVLGKKIRQSGFMIQQVVGKSLLNAQRLAGILGSSSTNDLSRIQTDADLYLITVSDDQVGEVARQLYLKNKIIVHTAGSVSMQALKNTGCNYGVLYPLQSVRKEIEKLPAIPVLIDGDTAATVQTLTGFAKKWAASVGLANDAQRLKLHVAAVIASNFTNHLYALTEQFCKNEKLDFSLLLPLISEVADRLQYVSPLAVQTGPAARGDKHTIQKHLELLAHDPGLQTMYSFITESIMAANKNS